MRRVMLATAFLLSSAGVSIAADADFNLRNRTGYQIDEVYVSAHSSRNWGRDVMGRDALADGETVAISFPRNNGACRFDIRVKYNDGDKAEWSDVNLCQYNSISLYWDASRQTTRAVGE